ncbi:MAG TPA: glycosyltransferase family 39 protein [Acidimicrobiales bacterium]|nr:glycosyltransferase family 39 protein [Acidimicrobiales bacterium]
MDRTRGAPIVDRAADDAVVVPTRAFRVWLAVIAAVALIVRLLQVAWVTGRQDLAGDAFYYYWQAQHNAAGHWFAQPLLYTSWRAWIPGADHPPGFVTLLTVLDYLGLDTPLAQRYFLAVLGVGTVIAIVWIMRTVVGDRAALIAGGIAAIYPNLWVNDGRIMSETMFALCFAVALFAFFRFRAEHEWRWLVLLAVALTLASSARPESLLLFALVLVPAVWSATAGDLRRRLAMIAVAALIPVATFAPWVVFNSMRFDRLVVMSTGAGQTLAQGNCSLTYYGSSIGLNQFKCLEEILPPAGRDVNAAEQDAVYREAAFDYMGDHLDRLPTVVLAREGRTWGLWRVGQQQRVDHIWENRGSLAVVSLQQWSWWIVGALAIGGAVLWRKRRYGLYPLGVQFAITVAVVGFTFGNTRYRVGVEVCAVLLAATSIEYAWRWWRRRSGRPGLTAPSDDVTQPMAPT